MRELVGWRVFYDDGKERSSCDSSWEELPIDGVLAVVEFYSDGTKKIFHGRDYYVSIPGKLFATNDIHPYLRSLGTVKYGRWSKDSVFAAVLERAALSSPPVDNPVDNGKGV